MRIPQRPVAVLLEVVDEVSDLGLDQAEPLDGPHGRADHEQEVLVLIEHVIGLSSRTKRETM